MSKFSHRSNKKELLDRDDIPFEDIKQNMKELDFINTWLGGHAITINGIESLVKLSAFQLSDKLTICEMGCGGGDNLRAIGKWCKERDISVILIGIDMNPNCIAYARSRTDNFDIDFISDDYRNVHFETKPDVIFSSLFCHHFTNEELQQQFAWMKQNTKLGFFVNDLQRHPLAYYSIKWLTKLFSKSYLVKNDAPLSVLRGFHKNELSQLLSQSSIINYQLKWKWAFRWLLTYKHEQ
ncbi:methyltransferase domain-containing protein [Lacibacter sp. MH-610]|uniref:methyltransferase domain-containing protein n=1 Tax=Lacibacter sp. MH-610 TaxID=3020883 RepID=UPI003891CD8E